MHGKNWWMCEIVPLCMMPATQKTIVSTLVIDTIHMLHEAQNSNLIKNRYRSWAEPRTQAHTRTVKKFSRQRASQKHDTTTNNHKKSQAGQKHCWDNIKRSVRQFRVGRTWNVRHYQMSAPDRKYMQATWRCHAHFFTHVYLIEEACLCRQRTRVTRSRNATHEWGTNVGESSTNLLCWKFEFFSGEKTHQFPQ